MTIRFAYKDRGIKRGKGKRRKGNGGVIFFVIEFSREKYYG